MKHSVRQHSGFSLLEMTLVIAILAIILFLVISISVQSIARSNVRNAENFIIQGLRRAQTLAQSNIGASEAGVYICQQTPPDTRCSATPSSAIIFQRSTFDAYNPATDDLFEFSSSITVSGPLYDNLKTSNGIVFTQLTGEPNVTGDLSLIDGTASSAVSLNGKGAVD